MSNDDTKPAPEHFPRSHMGQVDRGQARDTRMRPCLLTPRCYLPANHPPGCAENEVLPLERPAWDSKTPDPTGWRKTKP